MLLFFARIKDMNNTFLWYDLETFGLDPHYDRIAQFASVRTDMDLNIVDSPILLYSKLSPDYLPTPQSVLLTGITPQIVNKKGEMEAIVIEKIRQEMMKEGTISCGYNTIGFDDECIRSTLYRNLYDPYEREYKNNCSRWDLINLVRATRDLRPDGLVFEKKNSETNTTSFRLTDLTEENNIEQVGAHDALVDVYATIDLARLIKKKQPRIFSWALRMRGKKQINSFITNENGPFLHTCPAFGDERGNTHPLLPLFYTKDTELWCFDLTFPLPQNPVIGPYKETGFFLLKTNRCPFVAPLNSLDSEAEKRLGFTQKDVREKAEKIKKLEAFDKNSLLSSIKEPEKEIFTDPDVSLYGSFLSPDDKRRLEEIRELTPQAKLNQSDNLPFTEAKYHKLIWRYVARNWPEVLKEKDKEKWRNWCSSRLLSPPTQTSLSLSSYRSNCKELFDSLNTNGEQKKIILELMDYADELERTIINGEKK